MVGAFPALSETFVLNQITTLLGRGHSVTVLAERHSDDAAEHPDVARFGLRDRTRYELLPARFAERVVRLPGVWRSALPTLRALNVLRYGRAAASLRLAWSASAFGGVPEFDVVQCHFGALGLKAVLLREVGALRGRIVTAFHGEDIINYPRRFRGDLYAPLFAHGDLFLPVSARWNDALVAAGCPADRIRVHRMGVEVRRGPRSNGSAATVATAAAAAAHARPALRILTVARLVEKKGVADAIRAVSRLPVDYEYVIAGDGPLRAELEALAAAEGVAARVRFVGARSAAEVADLLDAADVFLAPSVTAADGDVEGVPVSIMEAMAAGLPVVSTRHSGIPELVADGVSGFLTAEHDVAGLTRRLSALAADSALRARMGEAGRDIVEREFEIGALTERLEGYYGELLSR